MPSAADNINFVISLDPDQPRQNVGALYLDPKLFDALRLMVSLEEIFDKVNFEKFSRQTNKYAYCAKTDQRDNCFWIFIYLCQF